MTSKRRSPLRLGLIGLASILAGCDYSAKRAPLPADDLMAGPLPSAPGRPSSSAPVVVSSASEAPSDVPDPEVVRRREVILGNVIKLMQTASLNPGGQNFAIATDNLNELFEGTPPSEYAMAPPARDFLMRRILEFTGQDPKPAIEALSKLKFTIRDARHIEDCMLYHAVATRVAGEGDDLTRVRRLFDWIVRQVQLVPPESLSGNGLRQAQARPADVLFRGMATEAGGRWSERGWLFMALCRQIGVDAGLLTFSPRRALGGGPLESASRAPIVWICAAVVDKKAYLFDPRIGIEIPGPDGTGVATLEDAIADPMVLDRLDLPGQFDYGVGAADLAGSPTKIGVLLDSSQGYLAPRMRLLQGQLRGEYRTILYRDPAEQADRFAEALGKRLGAVTLWELPALVEERLFNDPQFVASTQLALQFFDGKLPLLYARTAQLRGELAEATDKYVALRFAENAVMKNPGKDPIPPEVQRALDVYATFFLAQCQRDRGNTDQAEGLFRNLLQLAPEPGPGRYYYYMLRWGAQANLGRICEAKGDHAGAIAFYTQPDGTSQRHGNLLRARELALTHPLEDPVAPPPPAPKDPAAAEVKAAGR